MTRIKQSREASRDAWVWAADTTSEALRAAVDRARDGPTTVDGARFVALMTVLAAEIVHATEKFCAVMGEEDLANGVLEGVFTHLEECRQHPGTSVEDIREELDGMHPDG